jgi:DNA mismatch repair protein MutS2
MTQNQPMAFGPGDAVQVAALGKGVVIEVRNGDRYLIDIKGRSFEVSASQLERVVAARRSGKSPHAASSDHVSIRTHHGDHVARSLDLHGKTVVEAIEALDDFLNRALLAHLAEVRIIHGRSGGRLKAGVHRRLKQMTSIRFRVDPSNEGITIVQL